LKNHHPKQTPMTKKYHLLEKYRHNKNEELRSIPKSLMKKEKIELTDLMER